MIYADGSLTSYLQMIKQIPILSKAEEKNVANRIKQGDIKAKQKLVVSNLKFVIQIAKNYKNSNIPLIDLVSEGNLGLIRAAESFDPSRNISFISYAVFWIKQSIFKAIADKSNIMRIPLNWNNNIAKIHKRKTQLKRKLNQKNIEEIAKELNIDTSKVNELIRVSKPYLSIHQKVKNDNNTGRETEIEQLISEKKPSDDKFFYKNLQRDIEKVLTNLKPIEKDIISLRFGLNNQKSHTLSEIGQKYDLTKERIRQIEKKALGSLKKMMKKEEINYYLTI